MSNYDKTNINSYPFLGENYRERANLNPITKEMHRNKYYLPKELLEKAQEDNKKGLNVYTSIYSYVEEPTTSTEVDLTNVIFDRLVFDFDVEQSWDDIPDHEKKKTTDIKDYYYDIYLKGALNKAFDEARKVSSFFEKEFDIKPVLFFSGSKGCHLYVLFNNPVKLTNTDDVIKWISKRLREKFELKCIDKSVNTSFKNHLIRIPTSQNQTTKFYANQFDVTDKTQSILDKAYSQMDLDDIYLPVNDTSNLEEILKQIDREVELLKQNNEINAEINSPVNYDVNDGANIYENPKLQDNFLKVYKKGQRNSIGYRFIHLCRRSNIPEQDVVKFFQGLPVEQDSNEVLAWIKRAYSLEIGKDVVTGKKHFIEGIKQFAVSTDRDYLVEYFTDLFTRKDIIETNHLNDFHIIGTTMNSSVEATKVNGKYTTIIIKELNQNKIFNFKYDIKNNTASFIIDKTELPMKPKITDYGFELVLPNNKKTTYYSLVETLIKINKKAVDSIIASIELYITSDVLETVSNANKPDNKQILINQVRNKPSNTSLLRDLSEYAQKDFNIIKTEKAHYYYSQDYHKYNKPTMAQLNKELLAVLIEDKYDLRLPLTSVNTVLECIHSMTETHLDKWEFADNTILHTFNGFDVKKHEKPIITPKKLGMTIDGKFHFFEYKPTVKINNPLEEQTLTEKTLKEIFIPKTEPNNTKLYIDFLQRFGACFNQTNIHKTITLYYNTKGNNGKSLAQQLFDIVFGKYSIGTTPEDLQDQFIHARLNGKHVNTIDEIEPNDIKNHQAEFKRRSSPNSNQNVREMYTTKTDKTAKFGMDIILANIMPNVNITDTPFIERLDALEMPNIFKYKPHKDRNEYKINKKLNQEITQDFEGIEWLVNASIKAYKEMDGQFTCSQTAKETLDIILQGNELQKYLSLYTKTTEATTTSNKLILESYKKYCINNGIVLNSDNKTLSQEIGTQLSEIYGKDKLCKKRTEDGIVYALRILSNKEVEDNNNIIYHAINEPLTIETDLNDTEKMIYNWIKHKNVTNFKDLCKERNADEVDKTIKRLIELNYIEECDNEEWDI